MVHTLFFATYMHDSDVFLNIGIIHAHIKFRVKASKLSTAHWIYKKSLQPKPIFGLKCSIQERGKEEERKEVRELTCEGAKPKKWKSSESPERAQSLFYEALASPVKNNIPKKYTQHYRKLICTMKEACKLNQITSPKLSILFTKKACQSKFPYCVLIGFIKLFCWESISLDVSFLTEEAKRLHRI